MDKWLKKLGLGWTLAEDGTYWFTQDNRHSLKIIHEKGWVVVSVLDGQPNFGHYYPSFKQLLAALKG